MKLIAIFLIAIAAVQADEWTRERMNAARPVLDVLLEKGKVPKEVKVINELRRLGSPFGSFAGSRIVGGHEASPGQRPYQLALFIHMVDIGDVFCGSSLIAPSVVLTAAHCLDSVDSGTAVGGAQYIRQDEPNQQLISFDINDFTIHEGYDSSTIENDIGVIRLPNAFTLNEWVQAVSLPPTSLSAESFVDEVGTVSGWGKPSDNVNTISDVLRIVDTRIMSNTNCNIRFLGLVKSSNICGSGENNRGSCNGDSGGPFTVTREGNLWQVGVVSFGLAVGCEVGWPSVYTRVTSYLDWIATNGGITIA